MNAIKIEIEELTFLLDRLSPFIENRIKPSDIASFINEICGQSELSPKSVTSMLKSISSCSNGWDLIKETSLVQGGGCVSAIEFETRCKLIITGISQ